MTNIEKLEQLFEKSESGIVTTADITAAGIHRGTIQKLIEQKKIYKYSRGIYLLNEAWEDDIYLLQQKYSKGIFSHNTALYLLGYSDRFPLKYDMTFPQGYNSNSLKDEFVKIHRTKPEYYNLGVIEINSLCGNPIRVYNLERTLCEIVRGNKMDIQIIVPAMQQYAYSKRKDLNKLMDYAKNLHVLSKVQSYMQTLL